MLLASCFHTGFQAQLIGWLTINGLYSDIYQKIVFMTTTVRMSVLHCLNWHIYWCTAHLNHMAEMKHSTRKLKSGCLNLAQWIIPYRAYKFLEYSVKCTFKWFLVSVIQNSPECAVLKDNKNITSSERININSVFYSRHIVLFAVKMVKYLFAACRNVASKWRFDSEFYEADTPFSNKDWWW